MGVGAEYKGALLGNTGVSRSSMKEGENKVMSNVQGTIEEKESGKGLSEWPCQLYFHFNECQGQLELYLLS